MNSKQVIVAKIGAPYGVYGWVHIHSYTDPKSNILNYKSIFVEDNAGWKQVQFQCKLHAGGFVGLIEGIVDRTLATTITNKQLAISSDELPPPAEDEIYWAELEGLQVIDSNDKNLGIITEIFSTGANDVLVVNGDSEHLIPLVDKHVIKIDNNLGQVRVDWDFE